ncbi:hypothetical protein ACIOD2_36260 [Amycolatopsis sp. NPDC088138]|uniref:hypothetical protein n=1 Tax=Amycolatopsis sp. NPDC088138 TaxID=3363938 RepID=UPI0037FAD7AA
MTLAAVLLGAAASFTATTLTERGKWRRAHSVRWDDKRLSAYSEYAVAVKACAELSYRIAAGRGYPAVVRPLDGEPGLRELADAETQRAMKWESVLLLGSPAAVAAGREWHDAVRRLSRVVTGTDVCLEDFAVSSEAVSLRRDAFYEHARADLGIGKGQLPKADHEWLPPAGGDRRS